MRLTDHTDYSLRVLMYLNQTKALVTLQELAEKLRISRNNLIKVSNRLVKHGLVDSIRGKAGGIRIREGAGKVSLRAIVEHTEESFNLADCFASKKSGCTFLKACRLRTNLNMALLAFMAALEKSTLDDITT